MRPTCVGRLDQSVDNATEPERHQQRARPVELPPHLGVAAFGHVPQSDGDDRDGQGKIDEENGAPR